MLKSTDVMAPPKSAPQYRDVSRMIAEVGGIVKVSGSRMATPLAPPSPGSTPMTVPSKIPTTAMNKLNGVMARWKRSEEHTSELQSLAYLVCRLLLEKKKK